MPTREVLHGDGVAFLARRQLPASHALVTSMPDGSELPGLGFSGWRDWFVETAALVAGQTHDDSVAIFFQTDVKREGAWVDKGYLVARGAERAGAELLWHKVVCRAPAGTVTFGRPAYAHLQCFSRRLRLDPKDSSADVLPRLGDMPWPRAMGVEACAAVCNFLRTLPAITTVVDPFCGIGTMLAVANAHGFDAIGVERSAKRAKRASALTLDHAARRRGGSDG